MNFAQNIDAVFPNTMSNHQKLQNLRLSQYFQTRRRPPQSVRYCPLQPSLIRRYSITADQNLFPTTALPFCFSQTILKHVLLSVLLWPPK